MIHASVIASIAVKHLTASQHNEQKSGLDDHVNPRKLVLADSGNSISRLNALPVMNTSLCSQAGWKCASGKSMYAGVKRKQSGDSQTGSWQGEPQDTTHFEACIPGLLEVQALQTVTQTAQSVLSIYPYESLFVALMYRRPTSSAAHRVSVRHLMTVSPLIATNGQIRAHSVLLTESENAAVRSKKISSQLVYGQSVSTPSWIHIRMERFSVSPGGVWRLHTYGLYKHLTGVAVVTGMHPGFQEDTTQLGINIPGAEREKEWLC